MATDQTLEKIVKKLKAIPLTAWTEIGKRFNGGCEAGQHSFRTSIVGGKYNCAVEAKGRCQEECDIAGVRDYSYRVGYTLQIKDCAGISVFDSGAALAQDVYNHVYSKFMAKEATRKEKESKNKEKQTSKAITQFQKDLEK